VVSVREPVLTVGESADYLKTTHPVLVLALVALLVAGVLLLACMALRTQNKDMHLRVPGLLRLDILQSRSEKEVPHDEPPGGDEKEGGVLRP
jgi:hypothetical protein